MEAHAWMEEEWKREPESPSSSSELADDVWLFDAQPDDAQLLHDLDVDWVKEEPFPDWCEQKIDLNIFEGILPLSDSRLKLLDTDSLLQEFDAVCDAVALTPPQSPPDDSLYVDPPPSKPEYSISFVDDMILLDQVSQPVDVAMELAVVDELLRVRSQDLDAAALQPWEASLSPPDTSCDGSLPESGAEDPEWIPEPVATSRARKRSKPYSRPVEDKKLRKKEQNKNAATRYRQKKKQEVEVILDEEKGLEDRNAELQEKVTDLQREIKYLKGLMRDMFKAKGLMK